MFNTPHISLSLSPPTLPPYLKLQGKRGLSEIWRDCTSISVFVCLVCLAHKLFLLISFPFYVLRFTSKNESSIFGKYGKLFNFVPRGVCRYWVCEDIYENNWYDNAKPRRCKEGDYVVPSISIFLKHTEIVKKFWNCKNFKSSRFHNSSLDDAEEVACPRRKSITSPICFEKLFFSLSTSVFVFVRENFHENQKKNVLFLFSLRCRCGQIVEAPSLTAALAFHYLGLLLLFDFW